MLMSIDVNSVRYCITRRGAEESQLGQAFTQELQEAASVCSVYTHHGVDGLQTYKSCPYNDRWRFGERERGEREREREGTP